MIINFYFNNEYKIEFPRAHEQRRGADRRHFLVPMHNNKHGENELSVVIPMLFNELSESLFKYDSYKKVKKKSKTILYSRFEK